MAQEQVTAASKEKVLAAVQYKAAQVGQEQVEFPLWSKIYGITAAALSALQTSGPIELGNIQFFANGSCLYTNYVRGEALLASGQGITTNL